MIPSLRACALAALCLTVASARAGEVHILRQGPSPQGDVYDGAQDVNLIAGPNAGRHYGSGNSLWIGTGAQGDTEIRRALLRFDLSSLPKRPIVKATLRLRCVTAQGSSPQWQLFAVRQENAGWTEDKTCTGRAEANRCSWNFQINFFQTWVGGKGLGAPGEGYGDTPLFESESHGSLRNKTIEIELPPQLAEGWRQKETNAGLLLRLKNEAVGGSEVYVRFGGAEHPEEDYRPTLRVELE